MAKADKPNTPISIPRMDIKRMTIRLIGDAPLICHAWSEKAKKEMLDKQMKKAKPAKEAKSPEQDYEESLYRHPIPRHAHRVAADSGTGVTFRSGRPDGGYGFPSVTFKAAAVDACSHVDGITKVEARGAFHINGDLLKINGEPSEREDMVRVGMGTADIRYRGQFTDWSVDIPIRYNASVLSDEQIVHLFNIAGFGIGVGEWRPQRDGMFGLFHVEQG